jgi:hypothetical protein
MVTGVPAAAQVASVHETIVADWDAGRVPVAVL